MQDCWAGIRRRDVDVASGSYQTTQSQSKLVPAVIRNFIIAQDFSPKDFVKTIDYIYYGSLAILFLVLVRFWLWQPLKSEFYAWLLSVQFTTSITSDAHSCAHDIAVRDMAGLLTLIAESGGSPFPDVLQAERFLQAFRASFLGGRKELSSLRSWLQERHCWTDKNFGAHHWNDHGKNLLRTRYTTYQAPSAQRVLPRISPFSSMAATRIYTKIFGAISRSDNEKLQTDSARHNGYRRLATAKPAAGATALVPVSIASGDDLSTANSSYSRTITQDTKDSA
ncbi:uncharacterized protein ARMOST_14580 [Armillaria ostoyae]|uniref:Uncharacterized protein n=1 Tax=Armillaria ostoyae TaxID=47428 RepID=A0A284RQY1_ARMOS|nr:uncharacterized protein ARMOST_14580 [Armillaria ostoyae]